MNSSTRTASLGGSLPSLRNRRTLVYDAVSTSMENVDSGSRATDWNGLSTMWSYASVSWPGTVSSRGGSLRKWSGLSVFADEGAHFSVLAVERYTCRSASVPPAAVDDEERVAPPVQAEQTRAAPP